MADPSVYEDETQMQELNASYSLVRQDEVKLNKEWEALAEQIESSAGIMNANHLFF